MHRSICSRDVSIKELHTHTHTQKDAFIASTWPTMLSKIIFTALNIKPLVGELAVCFGWSAIIFLGRAVSGAQNQQNIIWPTSNIATLYPRH